MDDHGFFDESGKWNSEYPDNFKHWLSKNKGVRTVLKVKKWYKNRSINQNNYMHFVFSKIAEHTTHTTSEIKGFYKVLFNVKKTSELTTLEQEIFMDSVRMHALDFHGMIIPLPNEVIYD